MKKIVIKSGIFIFFFVLLFVIVNFIYFKVIVTKEFEFQKRIESLRFDNPDFEVLILGESTSFDGFDTELLTLNGIKSYNMAMGGSSTKTSFIQLSEYLVNYSIKPKYVLLGLNSAMVKNFDEENIHPIVEVTMKDHRYCLKDVPILKFKWLGFEFMKKIVSKQHRMAKMSYGQLKFQKSISDNTSFKNINLDIHKFESSSWLGEIAKLCDQNGIEFIVFEMPGYNETQNISDIGPYKLSFRNGNSASLYNFNSQDFCKIFEANKDWIGNSHLNEFGAIKFTNELISLLLKK